MHCLLTRKRLSDESLARIRPLIFQVAPAGRIAACAPAGVGTMSPSRRVVRSAGPLTGCRGFIGPVPPPLWMSVQFSCSGGHRSISTLICQIGSNERSGQTTAVGMGGRHRSIKKAAARARTAPKRKGAEGPKPGQAPTPCHSTPARSEAGRSSMARVAL